MTRRYGFSNPRWVRLFGLIDAVGEVILRPASGGLPTPRRVLLVNLAHLGDVIMTLPAVAALRRAFPSAHLAMLAGPWSAGVLAGHPDLDEIVVERVGWHERQGARALADLGAVRRLAARMRAGRYDLVINFKSFFQENLAAWLAGVPSRIGYGLYGGGFLHTIRVPFPWGEHTVRQHLALAGAAGASTTPTVPAIAPRDVDEAAATRLLGAAPGATIAIHLGAGTSAKQWPLDRFIALADRIVERWGLTPVVVGGPEEEDLARRFASAVRRAPIVALGHDGPLATAAIIRRCRVFVGGDSAPAHLAAAVGVPTLAIFSGTNVEAEWRPWGPSVRTLQERPECSPCGLVVCARDDHACMTWIAVDRVERELAALLDAGDGESR